MTDVPFIPFIPLDFWFCKGPSNEALLENKNTLGKYSVLAIDQCSKADKSTSFDELVEILDTLNKLEHECVIKTLSNILAIPMMYPVPQPLLEYKNYVNDLLTKFTPEWYLVSVEMSKGEQSNGYYLYDIKETTPWFRYDYFLKLEKLFGDTNVMSQEEFMKKYDSEASFEWSKFDEQGEYFVGFHKCARNKDSLEQQNAYKLTREANGKALYDLPYSHAIIFETITYGVEALQECPRFSNHMCEYVCRKLKNKK